MDSVIVIYLEFWARNILFVIRNSSQGYESISFRNKKEKLS